MGKTSKENLKKQSRIFLNEILCFVKYTPREKTIEICDREKALLEFHELLQKSTDLLEK